MTVDAWLRAAIADAEERGLPELKPLLENLALATGSLRAANFTPDAGGAPLAHPSRSTDTEDVGSAIPPPDRPSR